MRDEDRRTAILVSSLPGGIPRDVLEAKARSGERPRKDYVELARALDADLIDGPHMADGARALPRMIGGKVNYKAGQIAEALLRPQYRTLLAWGDYLGLCTAALLKLRLARRNLAVVSYNATGRAHVTLLRRLRVHSQLGAMFYQSSMQLEAAAAIGVPEHKLHRVFHPVDERFWQPVTGETGDAICAAGLEVRDYPTLMEAVRDLPVTVHLALASTRLSGTEAMKASGLYGRVLPENARVMAPTLHELRALYATSRFVVVPLIDVDHDGGATVITEAMAMGKAVIVTRGRGQRDIVRHKENGLYVPPGNPGALRAAIQYLIAHPDEAERMGRAGRAQVEAHHRLDRYVGMMAGAIRAMEAGSPSTG